MIVAGILSPLEHGLRHVLEWLHGTVGLPWAWSIVALTIIVRMLLVPLTVRQIHSMQNLQRHAPQMKEIQKKYKGDRQKMNEELMKFYRENNINPAASCLPMLAQFPVFIALYFVLNTFAKQAAKGQIDGSLEWLGLVNITAKASHGWGPLLLVIYAGSQLASTYFMSTTMDKTQRNILMILPVAFIFVIVNFKTGLVIYWATTNLWTVGQGLITRRLVPKGAPVATGPKRSSRTPPKEGGEGPPEDGDGAKPKPQAPKPAPVARSTGPPRKVKRKKSGKARR